MFPHLRVLPRESLNLALAQVAPKPRIQLPREIIVEFREELDVEEEHRGRGELVGDNVEEDLGAVILRGFSSALFRFEGEEAHLDDGGAVAEEDGFAA